VRNTEQIICSVDVGTTKICVLIARVHPGGVIEVVSSGYTLSNGLKKGVVVDLEEAAASIRMAREEAEHRSGLSVDWVTVGITGNHLESYNCRGAIQVEGRNREVTHSDVEQVIRAAQSIPIKPERTIIHVLTQEFLLDNREVQNPVGLTGSRLDANIHVVTCDSALLQNLVNAVNRADMRVQKVVLQQLASAESVLTRDERELGSAIVDIGGGTTDVAVFLKNALRFAAFIPVGGINFTRDLAIGLRTPLEDAEQIKKESGSVLVENIGSDEVVLAPPVGGGNERTQPRALLCEYLRARAVELFEMVNAKFEEAGAADQLVAGVVLTGGGSTLEGMVELAEQILEVPVRQGLPGGVTGLSDDLSHPVFATAIGLAKFVGTQDERLNSLVGKSTASSKLVNRFLSWVGN